MRVADVMSPSPVVIDVNVSLRVCRERMARCGYRHLPVVEGGALVGMVNDFAVFHETNLDQPVGKVSTPVAVVVRPYEDLLDTLRRQVWSMQEAVVVVDSERAPVGIFTEHDAVLLATQHVLETAVVEEIATTTVFGLDKDEPARAALALMRERFVRHAVLTQGKQLHGVLSYRDVLRLPEGSERTCAEAFGERPVYTTTEDESVVHAARRMAHHNIGILPVVDDDGVAVGVVSRTDVIRLLMQSDAVLID